MSMLGLIQARAVAIFTYSSFTPTTGWPYTHTYSYTIPSYNQSEANLASTLSSWSTGWGSGSVTGWDYVGYVDSRPGGGVTATGVYLGNGWVITTAHNSISYSTVYALGTTSYSIAAGSITQVGDADLVMFQLDNTDSFPTLPTLTLASSAPSSGKTIVTIGEGLSIKSWGIDTVSNYIYSNFTASGTINGGATQTFTTSGFITQGGEGTGEAIGGDSGGAGFVKVSGTWVLAGLMEFTFVDVNGSGNGYVSTGLIDLSQYKTEITEVMALNYAVPEPETWALLILGGVLISLACRRKTLSCPCRER